MHTDEYEISLSREIDVCRSKVYTLKNSLSSRERKFSMSTELFVAGTTCGTLSNGNKDFMDWMDDYRALRTWQATLIQYEELFSLMKI